MWYLVDKNTGKRLCYSKNKSSLEVLMAKVTYQHWELVYGD